LKGNQNVSGDEGEFGVVKGSGSTEPFLSVAQDKIRDPCSCERPRLAAANLDFGVNFQIQFPNRCNRHRLFNIFNIETFETIETENRFARSTTIERGFEPKCCGRSLAFFNSS
jgi:hypothetical protein